MDLNANEPLSKVVFNYHHPPFSFFFKNVRVYLPERELHELKLFGRHRSIQAKEKFICRIQFQLKDDEHF
jgi:hypothetical protein